jgi:hypothetical protein
VAYASIISGLVNTGFDIYNQLATQSPASKASEYSSWIQGNAQRYIQPFTNANYWNLNVPQMAQQSIGFGLQNAPAINEANMTQLQSLLNTAMPGWQTTFGQMQTNTNQLLMGQVPGDVQQQIQRGAAQQAIASGGYGAGAGTGTAGAISARDLGLTSLQLQQQGQTQGTNLISLARNYLMPQPVDPTSLLPLSDLVNASEWGQSAQFQANEAMYTAMGNVAAAKFGAPTTSLLGGFGGDLGSILTNLTQSPSGQSGGSGSILSSILGMFGGGTSNFSGAASGGGGIGSLTTPSSAGGSLSSGNLVSLAFG